MYTDVQRRTFARQQKKKREIAPALSFRSCSRGARGQALLPFHPFLEDGDVVADRSAHLDVWRAAALEPLLGEPGRGQVHRTTPEIRAILAKRYKLKFVEGSKNALRLGLEEFQTAVADDCRFLYVCREIANGSKHMRKNKIDPVITARRDGAARSRE